MNSWLDYVLSTTVTYSPSELRDRIQLYGMFFFIQYIPDNTIRSRWYLVQVLPVTDSFTDDTSLNIEHITSFIFSKSSWWSIFIRRFGKLVAGIASYSYTIWRYSCAWKTSISSSTSITRQTYSFIMDWYSPFMQFRLLLVMSFQLWTSFWYCTT